MTADVDGHAIVEHLLVDLVVKGAIVVAALVLAGVLGVMLWRRLS